MSDAALLPAIEIETGHQPHYAVIWLHGLGADGNDFVPIVPYLGLPEERPVRFIFPHAPSMPVTCNGGYVMPAWYDIISLSRDERRIDSAGVLRSCAAIRALIARENQRGIPTRNIVIAGFSQGGAIAYTLGLTHPETLAGIIALSTYLPDPTLLAPEQLAANRTTPIFAGHGTDDDVVGLELGQMAVDRLTADGYTIDWQRYAGLPHSVCEEEIADIGTWLAARLSALPRS
ncbi:MAG TPA: dienelactone hydrolase family protein [Rhodocyclaceae bacterium]|nr:dienelactone hydrolase family protein [Rhodocyclaceae bacterium]